MDDTTLGVFRDFILHLKAFNEPGQEHENKNANVKCVLDEENDSSDVVLEIEGRQLHASRAVLAHYSPVFHKMFFSDFRERTEPVVPLPGKTYADMAMLFNVLHSQSPSSRGMISDDDLLPLLMLADEYEINQIKTRCQVYMGDKLLRHHLKHPAPSSQARYYNSRPPEPNASWIRQLTLYLRLCDQFQLRKHRREVIVLLVKEVRSLDKDLVKMEDYKLLSAQSKVALLEELCRKYDPSSQERSPPTPVYCSDDYDDYGGVAFCDDSDDAYSL